MSMVLATVRAVKPYFERVLTGKARGLVSEVNLAEFYCKTVEKMGAETAEVWYLQIRQSQIRVVPPNKDITRIAALRKVRSPGLSLADCFALATWEEIADVLLTTDSQIKEFGGKKVVLLPISDAGAGRQKR